MELTRDVVFDYSFDSLNNEVIKSRLIERNIQHIECEGRPSWSYRRFVYLIVPLTLGTMEYLRG